MKVAEGTQAFMFETSLHLAVTKVMHCTVTCRVVEIWIFSEWRGDFKGDFAILTRFSLN